VRMRVLVLQKFTDTQRARQTLPMHTSVKNKNTVAQDFIKKIIKNTVAQDFIKKIISERN
jgi:hypothetical protein